MPSACIPVEAADFVAGDIDGDGDVDSEGHVFFTTVLLDQDTAPVHVSRSDLTGDADANGLNVAPMVQALLGN